MEKASGVNPEDKSGVRIPKKVRYYVQLRSGKSCDDAGTNLYWRLPFLWTTSEAWIEKTLCMGNNQSLIKRCSDLRPGEDNQQLGQNTLGTDPCYLETEDPT